MKILIVEDDQELLRNVLRYLDSFGYSLEKSKTFSSAYDKINAHSYDCVILDLNLPDGNGIDLIKSIKQKNSQTGILVLSANSNLDSKIDSLDYGADDYLTKPFHLSELNARLKAIIRRNKFDGNQKLTFKEIQLNTENLDVHVNGNRLKLTRKEYELLLYFIVNKDRVLTKHSISEHIWGDFVDKSDSFDFIYTHLKNLRKKIIEANGNDYIKTVYGIGYKMSADENQAI